MKNTLIRSVQASDGTWWFIQKNGTRQRAVVNVCSTCTENFLAYPASTSSYCSPECRKKECRACGALFAPKSNRATYCSEQCKLGSAKCKNCGEEYTPSKKTKKLFCSIRCHYEWRCPIGSVRPAGNGYMIIKVAKGTPGAHWRYGQDSNQWMLEHRYVMQVSLGRPLEKRENVHHINGKRDDNRPENLELWRKKQPCGIRAADYHCSGCSCFAFPRE